MTYIPFEKIIVWHLRESKQFSWNQTIFCFQLSIQLLLKRKLFAPESPNDWGFACRSLINNRFYKHSGSLGFASSKPSINNRVYKHSGPHGITNTEHSINDRFYKQFWPCVSHRLSGLKQFSCKTISKNQTQTF